MPVLRWFLIAWTVLSLLSTAFLALAILINPLANRTFGLALLVSTVFFGLNLLFLAQAPKRYIRPSTVVREVF